MVLLWLFGCGERGPVAPGKQTPPTTQSEGADTLVYADVGTAWGLVDTTDAEPFPGSGNGITIADLDEDGLDDVVLARRAGDVWVHLSRGDHFEVSPLGLDLTGHFAAAIDIDGDRHLDLLVGGLLSAGAEQVSLLRGDGAGGFGPVEGFPTALPMLFGQVLGISGADIDGDRDVDLYVTTLSADYLLVNDGEGVFSDQSASLDLAAWTQLSWMGLFVDVDGDVAADLFVANDLQAENVPSRLYVNEGDGAFDEVSAPLTVNAMGASAFDFDNDSWVDLFITNTGGDGLYQNRGDGTWVDVGQSSGAVGSLTLGQMHLGSAAVDLDNDGWTDIVAAAGRVGNDDAVLALQDSYEPDSVLLNIGGAFEEAAADLGVINDGDSRAVATGDLDGDGTLEVIIGAMGTPSHLFKAPTLAARSLDVELFGTLSNAYGIGARVEVVAGDRRSTAWIETQGGLVGGKPPRAHIGLGGDPIESVTVYWPSGTVQEVSVDPWASGRLRVEEEG